MKLRHAAPIGAIAALLLATPAYAADTIPVESDCLTGWYVNPDEQALLPESTQAGLVFDGASIVHRAVNPIKLADAPNGSINVVDVTGVAPLFKAETGAPYSTINVTADGKVWSSKIPTGPGSQDSPVASIAALAPLAPYTADTVLKTVGAGYANDTGNKATVTSLTFGATTYELTCEPEATPSATPTAVPTTDPTDDPTTEPSAIAGPDAGGLPVTGPAVFGAVLLGGGLVVGGALLVARWRRNHRFVA